MLKNAHILADEWVWHLLRVTLSHVVYLADSLCGILGIVNRQLWKPEYNFNNMGNTAMIKYKRKTTAEYDNYGSTQCLGEKLTSIKGKRSL